VSHVLVDGEERVLGEGIQVQSRSQDEFKKLKDSDIKVSDERCVEDGVVQEMETRVTE
jgi:hypothetical protein